MPRGKKSAEPAEEATLPAVVRFIAYTITHIETGQVRYVGITRRSLAMRWAAHKSPSVVGCKALASAIKKYGADAFRVDAVASATDWNALCDLEMLLIAQHGTLSPAGYNLTTGGDGGHTFSDETRARMKISSPKRIISPEARARMGHNKGKKLSPETRALIREATIIRNRSSPVWGPMVAARKKMGPPSTQYRERMSISHRGKTQSPETRVKISAALFKRGPVSAAIRAKISASQRGKKRSPEVLARIRALRKKPSPETRARMSASAIARAQRTKELASGKA